MDEKKMTWGTSERVIKYVFRAQKFPLSLKKYEIFQNVYKK